MCQCHLKNCPTGFPTGFSNHIIFISFYFVFLRITYGISRNIFCGDFGQDANSRDSSFFGLVGNWRRFTHTFHSKVEEIWHLAFRSFGSSLWKFEERTLPASCKAKWYHSQCFVASLGKFMLCSSKFNSDRNGTQYFGLKGLKRFRKWCSFPRISSSVWMANLDENATTLVLRTHLVYAVSGSHCWSSLVFLICYTYYYVTKFLNLTTKKCQARIIYLVIINIQENYKRNDKWLVS